MKLNKNQIKVLNVARLVFKNKSIPYVQDWNKFVRTYGLSQYSLDLLQSVYNQSIKYKETNVDWSKYDLDLTNDDIITLLINSKNLPETIKEMGEKTFYSLNLNATTAQTLGAYMDETKFLTILKLLGRKLIDVPTTVMSDILKEISKSNLSNFLKHLIDINYSTRRGLFNFLYLKGLLTEKILFYWIKKNRNKLTLQDINDIHHRINNLQIFRNIYKYLIQFNRENLTEEHITQLIFNFGLPKDKIKQLETASRISIHSIEQMIQHVPYTAPEDVVKIVDLLIHKEITGTSKFFDDHIEFFLKYGTDKKHISDVIIKRNGLNGLSYGGGQDFIGSGFRLLLKYCSKVDRYKLITSFIKDNSPVSKYLLKDLKSILSGNEMNDLITKDNIDDMEDGEIHHMFFSSKKPQEFAKLLITHKKGYLSKNNLMDLLLFTPNVSKIVKFLPPNLVKQLDNNDIEEIIYNAVDPKVEQTLVKFFPSEKLHAMIQNNLEPDDNKFDYRALFNESINETLFTDPDKTFNTLKSFLQSRLDSKLKTQYNNKKSALIQNLEPIISEFLKQTKNPKLVYSVIIEYFMDTKGGLLEINPTELIINLGDYNKFPASIKKIFLTVLINAIFKYQIGSSIPNKILLDILGTLKDEKTLEYFGPLLNRTNIEELIFLTIKYPALVKMESYIEMLKFRLDKYFYFPEDVITILGNKKFDRLSPVVKDLIKMSISKFRFREQLHTYIKLNHTKLEYLDKLNNKPYKIVGSLIKLSSTDSRALIKDKDTNKYGWIDANGDIVIKPIFDAVGSFNKDGIAKAEKDGKIYVVAYDGEIRNRNTGLVI